MPNALRVPQWPALAADQPPKNWLSVSERSLQPPPLPAPYLPPPPPPPPDDCVENEPSMQVLMRELQRPEWLEIEQGLLSFVERKHGDVKTSPEIAKRLGEMILDQTKKMRGEKFTVKTNHRRMAYHRMASASTVCSENDVCVSSGTKVAEEIEKLRTALEDKMSACRQRSHEIVNALRETTELHSLKKARSKSLDGEKNLSNITDRITRVHLSLQHDIGVALSCENLMRVRCRDLQREFAEVSCRQRQLAKMLKYKQQTVIAAQELYGRLLWTTAARKSFSAKAVKDVADLEACVLGEERCRGCSKPRGRQVKRSPSDLTCACSSGCARPSEVGRREEEPVRGQHINATRSAIPSADASCRTTSTTAPQSPASTDRLETPFSCSPRDTSPESLRVESDREPLVLSRHRYSTRPIMGKSAGRLSVFLPPSRCDRSPRPCLPKTLGVPSSASSTLLMHPCKLTLTRPSPPHSITSMSCPQRPPPTQSGQRLVAMPIASVPAVGSAQCECPGNRMREPFSPATGQAPCYPFTRGHRIASHPVVNARPAGPASVVMH